MARGKGRPCCICSVCTYAACAELCLQVLQRNAKQRQDRCVSMRRVHGPSPRLTACPPRPALRSIASYQAGGRTDLVESEEREVRAMPPAMLRPL